MLVKNSRVLSKSLCARLPVQITARKTSVVSAIATASMSPQNTPCKIGGEIQLKHRVVFSPLTRLRMTPGVEAPTDMVAQYYEQRSSDGGLLITECTAISHDSRGYVRAPGLYKPEQMAGWKAVVDRVHKSKSVFFMQLFHAGRVSHSSLCGRPTVAPSPVKMAGDLYVEGGVKADYETPQEATLDDIKRIVADFAVAAKRAVEECGFDGIEVHGGNGYLIQSFMAQKTNQRTDHYGGSVANRMRFLLEVLDACAAAVGPGRVGLKLQAGITFSDLIEPEEDVIAQYTYLGPELEKRKLAYVCVSSLNGEPYYKAIGLEKPNVSVDLWRLFRTVYKGTLMINGGIQPAMGDAYVSDGTADLVSYGVPFIANANLPELIAKGADLNPGGWNNKIWYGRNPEDDATGYVDWPLVTPK